MYVNSCFLMLFISILFFLASRTVYSKADVHRDQVHRLGKSRKNSYSKIEMLFILDELQALMKPILDTADEFSDGTSEWLMIEHRLQSIKEKFDFLFVRANREHREIKVNLFLSLSFLSHSLV